MENDKAQTFFILNDDDVIKKRVGQAIGEMFIGFATNQMDNQRDLGNALVNNYAVQHRIKTFMEPFMEEMLIRNLKTHLRVDFHPSFIDNDLHYRVVYGAHLIQQEKINLRGY